MYMLIYGYFIALILAPKDSGSMAYINPPGPSKRGEHIGWEINVICTVAWAELPVMVMWMKLIYDNM